MASERTARMMGTVPDYYQESVVFEAIQDAMATEYDLVDAANDDLRLQLNASTATWGLRYWEEALGIPTREADGYAVRRGRVAAKLIGEGNFSARLLMTIAEGYGQQIRVEVDAAAFLVTITFQQGIPTFLEEYKETVEDFIHAHLGTEYKFEYHYAGVLALTTEYKRWVYPFVFAATTFYAGTYPYVVQGQRTYGDTVGADDGGYTVDKLYGYCGTLYASEGAKI